VADFICAGRISAKIDKVAGIVETKRCGQCLTSQKINHQLWYHAFESWQAAV
jgi:hypothetical protein